MPLEPEDKVCECQPEEICRYCITIYVLEDDGYEEWKMEQIDE